MLRSLGRALKRLWFKSRIESIRTKANVGRMAPMTLGTIRNSEQMTAVLREAREGYAQGAENEVTLLEAAAGIAPPKPAHTGEQLQKDIDEHIANIHRWREEGKRDS